MEEIKVFRSNCKGDKGRYTEGIEELPTLTLCLTSFKVGTLPPLTASSTGSPAAGWRFPEESSTLRTGTAVSAPGIT
jgi:hypothetical protein